MNVLQVLIDVAVYGSGAIIVAAVVVMAIDECRLGKRE